MHRVSPRCRVAASLVLGLALGSFGTPSATSAQAPGSNPFGVQSAEPSWTESITSGVKRGWDGLTRPFTTEAPPPPAPDPTSLRSPGRPSPRLHVEVARLNEHAGRLDEAERHYQAALAMDRNDFSATLNYARLKDRQGDSGAAFELYRRAVQTHPREASVYNYLGLHYDRRGMPEEAAATFIQAVQLKPEEPLYRNNLAHVLVQLGRLPAAYEHLHAVHGEAVAYYNLGYLLHQRGQREAAVQHLTAALRRNANLTPARQLLAELAPNMRTGAAVPHVAASPPAGRAGPPARNRPLPGTPGTALRGQPGPLEGNSHRAPPEVARSLPHIGPPGAYPPPTARRPEAGRRPQLAPAEGPSMPPRAAPPREPVHREAYPQGPSYVEPPQRNTAPMRHRSATEPKQPEGIEPAKLKQPEGIAATELKQPEGMVPAQPKPPGEDGSANLKQPEEIASAEPKQPKKDESAEPKQPADIEPAELKQPEGVAYDAVRLNAPYVELTGAALAVPPAEADQ